MKRNIPFVALALVLAAAFYFRFPRIGEGLPYLYREDEAHHFNRVVEMVKSGDMNPHYFHKPSLHFYLRIPVVAGSFLWSVRQGYLRSVKEIDTRDRFGLAGYAFNASHPGIVKWNRAFSVFLSLLTVFFTYLIAKELSGRRLVGVSAALIAAVSPALIEDSGIIGVDEVVTFFCMASMYSAVRLQKSFSLPLLSLTGFLCGLAVSSKYNALPVVLLPILVCFLNKRWGFKEIALAFLTPAAGFLTGTPFSIVSLPLFLDQMAYEVFHYGVAGHVGHTAEPGWQQAMFYLKWMVGEGAGPFAAAFGLAGIFVLFVRNWRANLTFLFFPVLFALLMIGQRANFTRNMLVLIPCTAIAASLVLGTLLELLQIRPSRRRFAYYAFMLLAILKPVDVALDQRREVGNIVDTRTQAALWLMDNRTPGETAAAGQLQLPAQVLGVTGMVPVDQNEWNPRRLYLGGFDRFVAAPGYPHGNGGPQVLKLKETFEGVKELERVLRSPQVEIYDLHPEEAYLAGLAPELKNMAQYTVNFRAEKAEAGGPVPGRCTYGEGAAPSPGEQYCWVQSRLSFIRLENLDELIGTAPDSTAIKVTIRMRSPWPGQKVEWFVPGAWSQTHELSGGETKDVELSLPAAALRKEGGVFLSASKVLSPSVQLGSRDDRRLGVAVESISMR